MRVQVTIKGLTELGNQLNRLSAAAAKEARVAALKAGAAIVQEEAKRRAPRSARPRRSGHMADHIIVKVTRNRIKETEVSVGPDAKHWYATFVERGVPSRGIPARPLLRPALDQQEEAVQDRIRQVLRDEIRRLTGV